MELTAAEQISILTAQNAVLEEALRREQKARRGLEIELEELRRRFFGPRRERVDPSQLALAFAERDALLPPVEPAPEIPSASDSRPKSRRNGRSAIPADLPREREEIHPSPEDRICSGCGDEKVRIGEELTEELEYRPALLYVREIARVKYACRECAEGVVIADLPPRPLEKGRPGPGLLAHVITSKYLDHLPLHRLEGIFERVGVSLARSTMCDWIRDSAELLRPIVRRMQQQILSTGLVQTDATGLPVQLGGKSTHRAHVWAYLSPELAEVVYDFTLDHTRDGPRRFLAGFNGYLQADAHSVYDGIVSVPGITEVGCWAHCRRKYFEALDESPEHASAILGAIRRLYAIEAEAKEAGLTEDELASRRQKEAVPILHAIHRYVNLIRDEVLPRSLLAKAITYTLNQWTALMRYVEDGRIEVDNNGSERALRRIAVGRKNYMFAGSADGGRRAATLYSLTESCRMQGIDTQAYLRDVISRVKTHPASRIDELTPAGWKRARELAAPD